VHVQRDVKLIDNDGGPRQIDVLVTIKRTPHILNIVVECKHWGKSVERAQVDNLLVTVQKTNAAKGVNFTTKNYQRGALNTAQKNGIDAFLVREPTTEEMRAVNAGPRYLQLCSCMPEDRIQVSNDSVEVGTSGEWPRGISLSPSVRFGQGRTTTPILNTADSKSLEDLVTKTARSQLDRVLAPVGIIGDGRDCVGHFAFRSDIQFKVPILIRERESPPVVLRIAKLSVNVAVKIEQRRLNAVSPSRDHSEVSIVVENRVTGARFLVRCLSPDAPWVWMDIVQPPRAMQIPGDARLMVSSSETFNASCFSNPWGAFGRPVVYEISHVPASNTLPRVLEVLTASEPSHKVAETIVNGKAEKPAKEPKAKPAKKPKAKPAKEPKPSKPI
jgi:hypothetical protein